jgi:hypothetical protein
MKKTLLTLLLAGMSTVANCQSCLPEGIVFEFQSQIDNFQSNYPDCTGILGDVTIYGASIDNLDGLSVLTSVGGSLSIIQNPALSSLAGLENLASVGNDLIISFNPILNSLSSLSNLVYIGGTLGINNNDVLTSLAGLENIDAGAVDDLVFHDNPVLAYCDLEPICNYLGNIHGHLDIYNNADGCRNPPDIAGECGITLSCLPYGDYYLTSQADIDNFQDDYSDCSVLEGVVKISGPDIINLEGLSGVTSVGMYLTINNNDLLQNFEGLESLENIYGAVSIGYNSSLASLEGLDNLASIGGYLSVYNNINLTSFEGLNNLVSLGDMLEIMHNDNLVSLAALQNLVSAGNFIRILYNPSLTSFGGMDNIEPGTIGMLIVAFNSSLSSCEVESICDFLAVPSNFAQISDNAPGCNSRQEVEEACESLATDDLREHEYFSVYPNPTSSFIIIDTHLNQSSIELIIYSTDGRELVRRNINEPLTYIDVGLLPAGLYYGRLTRASSVDAFKFVKLERQ